MIGKDIILETWEVMAFSVYLLNFSLNDQRIHKEALSPTCVLALTQVLQQLQSEDESSSRPNEQINKIKMHP